MSNQLDATKLREVPGTKSAEPIKPPNKQSETPRTDAIVRNHCEDGPFVSDHYIALSHFARTLERELNANVDRGMELQGDFEVTTEKCQKLQSQLTQAQKERDANAKRADDRERMWHKSERKIDQLSTILKEVVEAFSRNEISRHECDELKVPMDKHECGCEVCARSLVICPASQSSIIQFLQGESLTKAQAILNNLAPGKSTDNTPK